MSIELPIVPGRAVSPERLFSDHVKLVRKIAWQVHSRMSSAIEFEDLMQTGLMTLFESVRSFEPRGEASFAAYASIRIRGAMIDQLRRQATMNRGAMRRRRNLKQAEDSLAQDLGRKPEASELAARLGVSLGDYADAADEARGIRCEALDEVYSDGNAAFAADEASAFEVLVGDRMKKALAAEIVNLPEREAMVLQLYFMEELSLDEIGTLLEVGAARVCQIKKRALDRLRERMGGWGA